MSTPIRGVCRFHNNGSDDVINTILQCLTNCKPLSDFFLSNFESEINETNPLGSGGVVARAFAKFMEDKWSSDDQDTISSENFKNSSEILSQTLDGSEMTNLILDFLHEDLNRVIQKPYTNDPEWKGQDDVVFAKASWNIYKKRNDSFISDNFVGQLKSTIVCEKCKSTSIKFESSISIALRIPDDENPNIYQSFELFTKKEIVDHGEAHYYCTSCKELTPITKKTDIWKTPEVLVIQFKRLNRQKEKIEKIVDFPIENLDLSEFALGNETGKSTYDLFAVADHQAYSVGGHYNAIIKNLLDGKWYKVDDITLSEIQDLESIKSERNYVLFYIRKDETTEY